MGPEGVKQLQTQIRDILTQSDGNPEHVARQIHKLFISRNGDKRDGEEVDAFFWALWLTWFKVVKETPPEEGMHLHFFAEALLKLKALKKDTVNIWSQDWKLWEDLPIFRAIIREEWDLNPCDEKFKEANDGDFWIAMNSFVARLHGATGGYGEPCIWPIRQALETEGFVSDWNRDCLLRVVREWIFHAGHVMYAEARSPKELDEVHKRALCTGPLAEGIGPGPSLERWKFWKQRLVELAPQVDGELKEKVEEAIKRMEELEEEA